MAEYSINIAQDIYHSNIYTFIEQIIIGEKLGALGIVIHFGKSKELSIEEGLNNMYNNLMEICKETPNVKIKILLETTSGQGTELCTDFEELGQFYKLLLKSKYKNRFGICLDTCHIFSAGYDIRGKTKFKKVINIFKKHIGTKYIKLIHLNDCKVKLGQRIDRHSIIGKGNIGKNNLQYIANYFINENEHIILFL